MVCRVGIDVGGTNTDAAVLASTGEVLGTAKCLTTPDVLAGVEMALGAALQDAKTGPQAVQAVMLGTTQFVNAAVQRRGLAPVAVLRLCGPATQALPPFCDIPPDLRNAVAAHFEFVPGGLEYDGQQAISPPDEQAVRQATRRALAAGAGAIVVCGVFSPLAAAQEEWAGALVRQEAEAAALSGGHGLDGSAAVHVVLSHRIGRLGLLERENASILNASLLPLAQLVIPACQAAVRHAGVLTAPVFLTANDGTLLSAEQALQMPVATFQSGPVNSLRGAAALTGLQDAVVIDIGGTTTDIGVLVRGLPRPAPRTVRFAGVTTNFQMPDVFSIGLGGGSVVRFSSDKQQPFHHSHHHHTHHHYHQEEHLHHQHHFHQLHHHHHHHQQQQQVHHRHPLHHHHHHHQQQQLGQATPCTCTVGPDSVGSRLLQVAVWCGGQVLTATDVAVVLGKMELGSRQAAEAVLQGDKAELAWEEMQAGLEQCLDAAKSQAGDVPVIVVGGGAPLCGDSLPGASHILRPEHAAVANAVGAAIPQVSGTVDAVIQLGSTPESRAAALQQAQAQARARAEAAGAVPGSCEIVSLEEIPLAYMPGDACRVVVKAVGELQLQPAPEGVAAGAAGSAGRSGRIPAAEGERFGLSEGTRAEEPVPLQLQKAEHLQQSQRNADEPQVQQPVLGAGIVGRPEDPTLAQLSAWQPVLGPQGQWIIHEADLHLIAIGTGILGTGGGGSPHKAMLKALLELQKAGPGSIQVVSPASLPDDALAVDSGGMGAPTVSLEKLDSHQAEAAARAALAAYRSAQQQAQHQQQRTEQPTLPVDLRKQHTVVLLAGEIGGGNGIEPLALAARMGLPVVDADLMGRAFPELQMMTSCICGLPVTPAAIADEKGNSVAVLSVQSAAWLERLLRPLCADMGASVGFASRPLTGAELKRVAVHQSLSYAWRLGHAVVQAQQAKHDAPAAAAEAGGGSVLFEGKVTDVQRRTTGGFAKGSLLVVGLQGGPWAGRQLHVLFQNENLAALEGEQLLACVPDLICCLETQGGLPVATEEVRYGLRLSVVCLPAHPILRSPEGLAVVGPAAFGHPELAYRPSAPYKPPQPVPGQQAVQA